MKPTLYKLSFLAFIFIYPFNLFSGDNKNSKIDGCETIGIKDEKIVASFEIQALSVSKDGMVNWTSKNESGSLIYSVEQFILNKWVAVGKIMGIGAPNFNSYSVSVVLNSGENKFRIKQKGSDKMSRFSNTIIFFSNKDAISYQVVNKNQIIEFSSDTYFIIYDPYGAIIKQGYSNAVDISDYQKGNYCLIYDNKLGGFEKKKVLFKNSFCPIIINPIHLCKEKAVING